MGKPADLAGLPDGKVAWLRPEIGQLRREIALACRVLAYAGLAADVLGHVSVRIGTDALLIRCRGPAERGLLFTEPGDVHMIGLDGAAALPPGYATPSELPIHAETLACTRKSALFLATTATRSPGPTPRLAQPPAWRSRAARNSS